MQARFLKHGGCLRGAAKAAVHAESLDMADRQASQLLAFNYLPILDWRLVLLQPALMGCLW